MIVVYYAAALNAEAEFFLTEIEQGFFRVKILREFSVSPMSLMIRSPIMAMEDCMIPQKIPLFIILHMEYFLEK